MNNPGAFEGCANPRAIEMIQQHITRANMTAGRETHRERDIVGAAIARRQAAEVIAAANAEIRRVHRRGWASMGNG